MLYFSTRARMFRTDHFLNQDVKRMLRKLQNIDKSALPTEDLLEVTDRGPGRPGTHTPAPERRVGQVGLGTRVSRAGAGIGGGDTRASCRGGEGHFSQIYLSWLVGLMLGVGPRMWAYPG